MKKILLIEDNKDHTELIIQVLQQDLENLHIDPVNKIEKAIDSIENNHYDLILSDYYIPGFQNENYVQNLHKIAPLTPIVIISGKGDEETAAKSIQSGAEDYIVKTREALQALPKILKRVWTKHQRNLSQRKKNFKSNNQNQKDLANQLIKELLDLEKCFHAYKNTERRTNTSKSNDNEDLLIKTKKVRHQLKSFIDLLDSSNQEK